MDELNQHECMANMTALLSHMQRNNITPKVEEVSLCTTINGFAQIQSQHISNSVLSILFQGVSPSVLPPWMKFLQGKLDNPSTPLNIRLFIAKLIINTEEVLLQHFYISEFIHMLYMYCFYCTSLCPDISSICEALAGPTGAAGGLQQQWRRGHSLYGSGHCGDCPLMGQCDHTKSKYEMVFF